ncbi:MAG TPA: FtsX-like permease family protein [Vicinamibacterales bacterium]|nr:FtsX-like permease family protein [Vicinamibacterales bacterium]
MSAPRWATALLRRLAASDEADVLIGDLEEAHRARVARRGAVVAALLTSLETADVTVMLLRKRIRLPQSGLSGLDFKLGVRMLVRYPVLTLVGSGSLALAIAIGSTMFAFISLMLWPRLPLPDGDQLVRVQHYDRAGNAPESRVVADFLRWRGGTGTLGDVSAGRAGERNIRMGDGIVEPISVAEVTASTFAMARVAPILGRTLTDADATAAAPPVLVIGERIWRERFAADPGLLGARVLVSDVPTAVVGVMPAAFRFPSVFEAWQPLKIDDATVKPRAGMGITIWARMKPRVTPAQANAELAVLSAQAAADWPATHAHLSADIHPVAFSDISNPEERTLIAFMNLVVALLVLVVSGNVALLMFARAATRESEIVVRTALGASRGRLVAQFVAEALVLSAIAAIAGLTLGQQAMAWGVNTFTRVANDGELLPFWITSTLPPISIAYGIGLALMATAVTGILPALKMTKGISSRLRETSAGGGGLKFGGVWTVLIVTQIAVTVTFPAIAFFAKRAAWQVEDQQIGVPAERYLSARLSRESGMTQARFETGVRRVREDLAAVLGVARVSLADRLPLMWNGHHAIEMDEGGQAPTDSELVNGHRVSTASVEPDFFPTFEAAPIAGRLLGPADYGDAPHVAVVNQSFVKKVLGGRNAIGRRIRYQVDSGPAEPWREIVGVVRDMGMAVEPSPKTAGVYLPIRLREVVSVMIAARVSGDMTASTNALRSIVAKADPALRVSEVQPLSLVTANELRTINYVVRALSVVSLAAVVLALSGIYAVMSFAVSRRTREIGIRIALGSKPSRVVIAILRRPLIQVTAGIVFGGVATFAIASLVQIKLGFSPGLIGYLLVMLSVCLLACVAPARRALKVDPIAALRTE